MKVSPNLEVLMHIVICRWWAAIMEKCVLAGKLRTCMYEKYTFSFYQYTYHTEETLVP